MIKKKNKVPQVVDLLLDANDEMLKRDKTMGYFIAVAQMLYENRDINVLQITIVDKKSKKPLVFKWKIKD